ISLFRGSKKRELTDQQNVPLHFHDREIHHAVSVIENAQPHEFAAEPFDIFVGIRILHREQDKQSTLNSTFDLAIDGHVRLGDSLNDCAHENLFGFNVLINRPNIFSPGTHSSEKLVLIAKTTTN